MLHPRIVILCLLVCARIAGTSTGVEVPPGDLEKIRLAAPFDAPAKSKKPRKVLVFSKAEGFVHDSIPWGAAALRILGEKTGAYTATLSDDPAMFDKDKLDEFDAVIFNNNCGDPVPDPARRKNLLDFVRGGRGLVGIHCAAHLDWPEYIDMLGGYSISHPWNEGSTVTVKLDDPDCPLLACFCRSSFEYTDEIFVFGRFSREKVRVLLSLDTDRTDMNKPEVSKDQFFPLSWIRDYGEGRVFYSALGHQKDVYWRTPILKHYLAGIQYALGDLPADASPRATHNERQNANLCLGCRPDNELYKVLLKNKIPCARFDTPEQAIREASVGGGVLILADCYPAATTALSAELFQRAAEKTLRLYVEYPSMLPDAAVGEVQSPRFGPWGVLWDRGVVASDFFGKELPALSIVMIHDCHRVSVAAEKPHLVLARVAGYDRASLGLPKKTQPILFQLPRRDVLVSTTKLSQFVTGRYAPTDAWQGIWRGILGWLRPGAAPPELSWTPTVRASYDRTDSLPPGAQKEAVRRGAEWFLRSGLLVDPSWKYGKHREDELKPVLWPDWRPGDGSRGILEGYMTRIRYDGRQGVSLDVRDDCNAETAMALKLGGEAVGNAPLRETAERLIRYNVFETPMVGGSRADPQNPNYGLIGWSLGSPTAYYGDDNARALLGTIAAAAAGKNDDLTPFILRGVLANFRVTGPQGFRPALLDEGALAGNGWRHYWTTNTVQFSPHYEAWIWTTYLWLYRQTGFTPLLDRAREGVRRMMAAYPKGWFVECGRREADLARMLLPLAWLVRADDTPEHRAWLRRVADDLLALQNADGAIPQRVDQPYTSNDQYGTGEAPIIYKTGDPATDLLYTLNFAAIGLHEAAAATGDAKLRQAADRTADFLIRCQVRSKAHPELDGAWFRSFDFKRWEYYGSDGDMGWGVWCCETGWTQSWIVATLALRELKTSLWDYAARLNVEKPFRDIRPRMIPDDVLEEASPPRE